MHFLTLFWKILFAFIPPTGNSCGNLPEYRHQLSGDDGGGGRLHTQIRNYTRQNKK